MKKLQQIINSKIFNIVVVLLILANAAILGANTYLPVMKYYGEQLFNAQVAILWFFVAEIALKIICNGKSFFKRKRNIFDVTIVTLSILPLILKHLVEIYPEFGVLSFLSTARILMVLMLISDTRFLRRTIGVLRHALSGVAAIAIVLSLVLYIFAVIASNLFGGAFPEWYGNLHLSLFSLFQVMTLEGWVNMVNEIMELFPWAWAFFVLFIIVTTFTILNLLIAVMVDSLQHIHRQEEEAEIKLLKNLQAEIAEIKQLLKK